MRGRLLGTVLALAGALALGGCGWIGGDAPALVCPGSYIAPDAGKQAIFNPGAKNLTNVRYGVEIQSIRSGCSRARKGILVDTKLTFKVVAQDPTVQRGAFRYFVSVVDSQQNILTKKTYVMPFALDSGQRIVTRKDELFELLPLRNAATGGNYAIVAGLQLTREQLKFNRSARRPPGVSLPASRP
ncbi:MAG: hypothetical protein ACREFD_12810 [Stellaceae bacterium]